MASRPNKGEGLTPLPTPQQKAAFIAALLAPLPKDEAGSIRPKVVERQVRDDERATWLFVVHRAEALRAAYDVAEHARLSANWSGENNPPHLLEASQRAASALVEAVQAIAVTPCKSRAHVEAKQAARRCLRNVFYPSASRADVAAIDAAIADDAARFPKGRKGAANA